MLLRFDSSQFSLIDKGNDFSRYLGVLSVPGVLNYNGTSELIPDSELFSEETVNSFKGVPIVVEHPGIVDSGNWKNHIVGSMGDSIRKADNRLVGEFTIYDSSVNERIQSGDLVELSICRFAEIDVTPGVYEGVKYDAIQRKLRGNHVALTVKGRAGKSAKIITRLDSGEFNMLKYRADSDGKDYDIPEAIFKDLEILKAKQKELEEGLKKDKESNSVNVSGNDNKSSSDGDLTALKKAIEEKEAILNSAKAESEAWKKKFEELEGKIPSIVESSAKERLVVVEQAKAVLGDSFDFGNLSVGQIKDQVIAKALPYPESLRSDSISDSIRDAYFSAAMKLESKKASINPVAVKQDSDSDYRYSMHNFKGGK